jgi:[ribosomal protein S5]-alanine N-acetyltransferase
MFDWAMAQGVHRFVASISPDNKASLSLAAKLGFERVGEQIDDIDGLEYVFETTWPQEGA